ncbi:MAG: Crp/Fnr family transcriptional regulator [Piscinibacter sp.]|nr:Crp/Fnr family transcriptional regulator [Piscinibacter sp.]
MRPRSPGRTAGLRVPASRSVWSALLGDPAPAVIDDLEGIAAARPLPAGSLLLSRHEPARELLALAAGDAALGVAHGDLPFQPERTLQGPQWLDAASAWLGGMPAQDAVALSDVQLLVLPRAALQPLLARHPELARQLLLVLARQVHQLTTVAHDLMHKDAEARFADWLMQHSVALADAPKRALVTLHERKRDIAAQLGITPETLSRLLRQLSRKGLIEVKGYAVTVLDLPALRAIAGA